MHLATVGKSDGLAWLNPETYAVVNRRSSVPYFTLFDECDCRALHASVLDWSRDSSYLATTTRSGRVDLRDTEKQLRIATLPPPIVPGNDFNWSSEQGPALARFSPDGKQLVALYPGHVVAYDTDLPPR